MATDVWGVKGDVEPARGPVLVAVASTICMVGAFVHQLLVPADVDVGWAFRGFILVIAIPYVVVGTAVRIRSPENRIGRLLQAIGFLFAVAGAVGEYGLHGLVYRPGSLPGSIYMAWVLQWAWVVIFGLSMFVFLLFPDGRYLSPRWRRFGYVAGSCIVIATCSLAFAEGPLDSFTARPVFRNPLGVDAWKAESAEAILMVWVVSLAVSALSLFIRFRQATGVVRQQLKWLALGGLFTAVAFLSVGVVESSPGRERAAAVSQILVTIGIALLPMTIGVAILRYRLYEIDVLINRAIVYVLLTVALAAAYIGLVFGFQALLSPFTAESDLAIAASTLGVAALFRPVRSRVQDFIDRRFYRRKFDAERTVADFSIRLRNEVELGAVTSQLTAVVAETMQPVHVSLWLRGGSS